MSAARPPAYRNEAPRARVPASRWGALALALSAIFLPCAASAQPATPPPLRNALLISWDGAEREVVKELLAAGRLPHLAALIKQGSMQDIQVIGQATSTKPGHARMLTGLSDKTTGVLTNKDFRPIPEGYTIFERARAAFGKDAIRTFMVTGKLGNVGGRGPGEAAETGKGEPFFLTRKSLDHFDAADREADAVGPLGIQTLLRHISPRFLGFIHFADPDRVGHKHGSASAEFRAALVECDARLGHIIAYLQEHDLARDTGLYVTADHGFKGKNHTDAPNVFLATNDKAVARGGTQADIPATILARLGVDLAALDPPLVGKPLLAPAPVETSAATVREALPAAR
jgi:predicted AlkP superfamily pyrophosphatase or phosphodiesterase